MLKRISVVLLLVVILVSGSFVLTAAAQKYTWSLASVLPESHPVHSALVYFADQVAKETNGVLMYTKKYIWRYDNNGD